MGYELTGVGLPWLSVQWQKSDGDRELARRVVTFMEDRRVLFGDRHLEDERHCVQSAQQIRAYLTDQIMLAKPGQDLEASIRAMRAAARKFVDAGGPDARNFDYQGGQTTAPLFIALGDLRTALGYQIALILSQYPQHVEPDLLRILPPADLPDAEEDLSFIPGFN